VVKLLVKAGADVNIQNADELTALDYAWECGHNGIITELSGR
jgi:ankyrin repeat protein